MAAKIGVGIIGVHPARGWASTAHIPALRALPEYFIAAISHPDATLANESARKFDVPRAFDNLEDLVCCPAVDLVVVTVRVPRHFQLVSAAIRSGKAVFCEWPLGNGLQEALKLQWLAENSGIRTFAGLQSRASAELRFMRDLIRDNYIGEALSGTLVGSGIIGGAEVPEAFTYTLDPANGAGVLNVAFAHAIDSLCFVLDDNFGDVVATLNCRRKTVRVIESGETIPMSTPDQITLAGVLTKGPIVSAHVRGGLSRATNFQMEINGTRGDLVVSGSLGYPGVADNIVRGARDSDAQLRTLAIPDPYLDHKEISGPALNVLRQYAQIATDLTTGSKSAPSFADACVLHRLIDATERAAATGSKQKLYVHDDAGIRKDSGMLQDART